MWKKIKHKIKGNTQASKREAIHLEIENGIQRASSRPMVYLGSGKALTETIFGSEMIVNTSDMSLSPHILMKGCWEIWITQFLLELLEESMVVLEIGANIGYYSVLSASRIGEHGKLYAFEADPLNFELLHRNLEINGFLDRVELTNKAVFDKSKTINFYKLCSHHGSSSAIKLEEDYLVKYRDRVEEIKVPSISIDDFFGETHTCIDVIKIDAEGSEPFIFRGMRDTLKRNPKIRIICEFAPSLIAKSGESPEDFLDYLGSKLGFSLSIIDPLKGLKQRTKSEILELPYCELYLERTQLS